MVNRRLKNVSFFAVSYIVMVSSSAFSEPIEPALKDSLQRVLNTFGKMKHTVSTYQRLPCLGPEASRRLGAIGAATVLAHQKLVGNYKSYMADVGSDIVGKGAYNKAFKNIASASKVRMERSQKYEQEFDRVLQEFGYAFAANFLQNEVDVVDNSASLECSKASFQLDNHVHSSDEILVDAIADFRMQLSKQKLRFQQYQAMNAGLVDRAGALGDESQINSKPIDTKARESARGFKSGASGVSKKPETRR